MNYKKLLCLLLCFCMVFSAILSAAAVSEDELQQNVDNIQQEIQQQQQELEELNESAKAQKAELEKLKSELDEVESEASAVQGQVHETNERITELTNQYNELNKEIEKKSKSIVRTTATIKETEKSIENSKENLSAKLRSAYMNGSESTLEILMGADNLASFLTRLELMKRTSENDKKVITDFQEKVTTLKKAKEKLEKDKATIEEDKKKVAETREEYIERKSELEVKQKEYKTKVAEVEKRYSKIEAYIEEIDREGAAYQSYIDELERKEAQASQELEEYLKNYLSENPPLSSENNEGDGNGSESSSSGDYYESNDTWSWPLGSRDYIVTSGYGYRESVFGEDPFHGAVDLSGANFYGTSIYAARAGTVIRSNNDPYGYGNCVIIDHGDGFHSLYAHNSYNAVSVGDYVQKGQLIAYAGSTGLSTGAHLHYEIRYNGSTVNPANYHPGKI